MNKLQAWCRLKSFNDDTLSLVLVANHEATRAGAFFFDRKQKAIEARKNGKPLQPLILTLSEKHKPRTIGKNSQNHKLYSILKIIAQDTGNDVAVVKYEVKRRAMAHGYPSEQGIDGQPIYNKLLNEPLPMSEAKADTVQESLLIDEAYRLAAELGIFIGD